MKIRLIGLLYVVFCIGIFLLESCDPNYGVGIQNNTRDTVYFNTTHYTWLKYPIKDSECAKDTILPGKFYCFNTTCGHADLDTSDFVFDNMQLIKKNKTLKISGKKNIFLMFRWDPRGAYFFAVDDYMFKKYYAK